MPNDKTETLNNHFWLIKGFDITSQESPPEGKQSPPRIAVCASLLIKVYDVQEQKLTLRLARAQFKKRQKTNVQTG